MNWLPIPAAVNVTASDTINVGHSRRLDSLAMLQLLLQIPWLRTNRGHAIVTRAEWTPTV
jgi:hypothetical protein